MPLYDFLKRELTFFLPLAGLMFLLAVPFTIGSSAELRLFPVLQHQVIPANSVWRDKNQLCWTWVRDKLRSPSVVNMSIKLLTADGYWGTPEIRNEVTNIPWHRAGARPPGHYEDRFCAGIPPFVTPDTAICLKQTLVYEGFWGLWMLNVPLPDIRLIGSQAEVRRE